MRTLQSTSYGWLAPQRLSQSLAQWLTPCLAPCLALGLALGLASLPGCVSPAASTSELPAASDSDSEAIKDFFNVDGQERSNGGEARGGEKSDAKTLPEKIADLEGELQEAEAEARIGELKGERDRAKARHEVAQAELAVESKREALSAFREVEGPHIQAEGALDVLQAETRLEAARQDLEGILEIYEGEEEARAKQEIIRRNRVAVDIATQRLENTRVALRLDTEFNVPRKVRELEASLMDAEFALRSAQGAVSLVELESAAGAQKGALKIKKLQDKLRKLKDQASSRSAESEADSATSEIED